MAVGNPGQDPLKIEIPPEQDARYPIYQAIVEREWRTRRPGFVQMLENENNLQPRVNDTATMCVRTLQEYESHDLGLDMGREAAYEIIFPESHSSNDEPN